MMNEERTEEAGKLRLKLKETSSRNTNNEINIGIVGVIDWVISFPLVTFAQIEGEGRGGILTLTRGKWHFVFARGGRVKSRQRLRLHQRWDGRARFTHLLFFYIFCTQKDVLCLSKHVSHQENESATKHKSDFYRSLLIFYNLSSHDVLWIQGSSFLNRDMRPTDQIFYIFADVTLEIRSLPHDTPDVHTSRLATVWNKRRCWTEGC